MRKGSLSEQIRSLKDRPGSSLTCLAPDISGKTSFFAVLYVMDLLFQNMMKKGEGGLGGWNGYLVTLFNSFPPKREFMVHEKNKQKQKQEKQNNQKSNKS